ncbi:MAG: tRNA (adenosine(37)-N6)-dimethylallyltransferase MiaA [Candidatus Dormibacteria bacterium]
MGPTASGKTRLVVALARALGGEVVNADSRQAIAELRVGTCKPGSQEQQGVPHHGFDWRHLGQPYSVAEYTARAQPLIATLLEDGRAPLVVGGTGLYLRALLRGFDYGNTAPGPRAVPGEAEPRRDRLQIVRAQRELSRRGRLPASPAERANPRRLVRALELARAGRAAHEHGSEWPSLRLVCVVEPETLRSRIAQRSQALVGPSLCREVDDLLQAGFAEVTLAAAAIGYAEVLAWRAGRCSQAEAVAGVRRRTWRYARAQMTWLRKEAGAIRIDASAPLERQLRDALRAGAGLETT